MLRLENDIWYVKGKEVCERAIMGIDKKLLESERLAKNDGVGVCEEM